MTGPDPLAGTGDASVAVVTEADDAAAGSHQPGLGPFGLDWFAVAGGVVFFAAILKFGLSVSWALAAGFAVAAGLVLFDLDVWRNFWFAPMSGAKVALWRTMFGWLLVAWAASITPNIERFYGANSFLPDPEYFPSYRLGLMRWFDSPAAAWGLWAALLGAGILIASGRLLRLATALAWVALMSLHQANPLILNSADDMVRLFAFFLMLFVWFGPRDAARGSLRPGPNGWVSAPAWLVRLVQCQLSVIYPATFVSKIGGATWRDGTAALYALNLEDFKRFPVPEFVRESLWLGGAFTWSALLLEFALFALLWYRPTRWLGIGLGVAMHLGFAWAMSLGFFTPVLLVGYLMFVDDAVIERALGRFLPSRRQKSAGG